MVKLSEIELPVILEKKLLFGPGKWNDWNIEEDEVLKSIHNTEWNKKTRSLFYSHEDDKAEKWVGSITNEFLKNGKVYGDLKICDADLAFKLTDGEAPFAVSAGIKWPAEHRDPVDFSYRNFSLVVNPGVHNEEIYINFADKKTKNTFNEAKLIYSKANFEDTEKVNETLIEEVKDKIKEAEEETQKPETTTEKSNLNIDERGLNANMVNEEKTTETIEEESKVKSEEKVEEVETKEEVKEESKDEPKEETTDADFSELKTKLDEAISRIKVLEEKQANFEEVKSEPESKDEPKEEVKEEEETKEEEEVKEEEESKEETEETVADFKKIADKLDRVASALENKAAPMSTAEFSGTKSKKESVTDRLTSFLDK